MTEQEIIKKLSDTLKDLNEALDAAAMDGIKVEMDSVDITVVRHKARCFHYHAKIYRVTELAEL